MADSTPGDLQRRKYMAAKRQIKRHAGEIEALQESICELQQTNRDLRKTTTMVNKGGAGNRVELSMDALRLQVGNLTSKRKKQTAENNELQKRLAAQQEEVRVLHSKLETPPQLPTQATTANTKLKQKALRIRSQNKQLAQEVDQLRQQVAELEQLCTEQMCPQCGGQGQMQQADAVPAQARVDAHDIEVKVVELSRLTESLVIAESRLTAQKKSIQRLKAELGTSRETAQSAARDAEVLRHELQETRTDSAADLLIENTAIREGIKQYKMQNSELESKVEALECDVLARSDTEERCQEQHTVIESMHCQIEELREQLAFSQQGSSKSSVIEITNTTDESHLALLQAQVTEQEVTVHSLLRSLSTVETNAGHILASAEIILAMDNLDSEVKVQTQDLKRSIVRILKTLEAASN